jgi:riboflavin synthase
MFTGLIESIGVVAEVNASPGGYRLRIRTALASALASGDSLAVDGVCLTVVTADADAVRADIGPETARVTTLGSLRQEDRVNLERPMRADGRLGGHFVQGHVDTTALVDRVRSDGDSHWLTVSFERSLARFLIPKGSVAIDGVSLTIAALREDAFDVMLIPFTWANTALSSLEAGDRVNIECDMIGKYVVRALAVTDEAGRLKPA